MKTENAKEDSVEEKFSHPIPNNHDTLEVVRSVRDVPPAHYTFKVESFSLLQQILSKTGVEKYESGDFEAGGYKWKLAVYPNGNKKRNGDGHISLYLMMAETNTLPLGWEVNVIFSLFVYDQIRDKYFTLQDSRVRRFYAIKTEWGFPQFISLSAFIDASNGYLVDDCCVFGAEVFIIKCEGKGESLSFVKEPNKGTCTWKIDKFSGLKEEYHYSDLFTAGELQWKLKLYPKGNSTGKGNSLSLYLCLSDFAVLRPGWKVYVEFELCIRDQVYGIHKECTFNKWFCASIDDWGYNCFMSLSDLHDSSKGYIVDDTLIAVGKITLLAVIKDLSLKCNESSSSN